METSLHARKRGRGFFVAIMLICAAVSPGTVQAQTDAKAGVTEVVVHTFAAPPRGANPYSGLYRDSAGNLYGTASFGGSAGAGVVYKIDARGRQTVLYNFSGGSDGRNPQAGVVLDSAGNLYGTTSDGGTTEYGGVVYKLDPSGKVTVLHSFTDGPDGGEPFGGVVLDTAGNLYGTAYAGGTAGWGLVYKLDPSGNETVLHNFTGLDGGAPQAGVVLDTAGNLYGTTVVGGTGSWGVVYRLDPSGNETVLHNFTDGLDGGFPYAGVVLDTAGNVYGTTQVGGSSGLGVVYKVDASGNETVLHNFTGGTDGEYPYAGVVLDSAGNVYGTSESGGSAGWGFVYKLDQGGNETVLHNFTGGTDGAYPYAGVIRGPGGSLYGTTFSGGSPGLGVVFQLASGGNETVMYVFPDAPGGWDLLSGVTRDSAGNLYGTTALGGTASRGVAYKLNALGIETVLHNFTGGSDGGNAAAGLVLDSAGNLYGTATGGGSAGGGVVYKLDPSGNETVLYSFTGGSDGGDPVAGVVLDSSGNLYGTTYYGGTAGQGVVYKLDPGGNETVLYSFTGGSDGSNPAGGVVLGAAGNLYGTTYYGGTAGYGVVYKLDSGGNETVLHNFTGGTDGEYPRAAPILDSAGNLYGTAIVGGAAGYGVVYKLDPSGNETVLHTFTGGSDGGWPFAGVVFDSSGNLYGTATGGGSAGGGVVYRLDPSGNETVLYSFTGGSDGGGPYAGVILDTAGALFGTSRPGGQAGGGVVYKLKGAVPRR